ncbi:SDR family oxidoreductase [candidate division KSB1 bacterium]|nr:SDR family oxidoreductase [candidate division KSB1 bacterium]
MKVLFIGGTGVISTACTYLAIERGFDLYLLTRGQSSRKVPREVHLLKGDIRNDAETKQLLTAHSFDVVVNWIAYMPDHIEADLRLFGGKIAQYIFISSASAYQIPPVNFPLVESTPLHNPWWAYSRAKIACEERLMHAYRQENFPATIIRPSHTYDQTKIVIHGGYTTIDRMRRGKAVVVHGDGTSLWTLTHSRDFAKGFVGLMGNPHAIGEAFHITSDEILSWNQIYEIIAGCAGCTANVVHIPSEFIAQIDPDWGASLLGDKACCKIFDNSKIKRIVPEFVCSTSFSRGAEECIAWYDAEASRRKLDASLNRLYDKLINVFSTLAQAG